MWTRPVSNTAGVKALAQLGAAVWHQADWFRKGGARRFPPHKEFDNAVCSIWRAPQPQGAHAPLKILLSTNPCFSRLRTGELGLSTHTQGANIKIPPRPNRNKVAEPRFLTRFLTVGRDLSHATIAQTHFTRRQTTNTTLGHSPTSLPKTLRPYWSVLG